MNPRRPDVTSRLSSGCLFLSFHGSLSVDTREIFAHDLDPVYVHACDSAGKESACNAGDLGSIPGLGRFPWRREQLLTPVFWPGEFHGLYSPWGRKELDTTEQPSLSLFFFHVHTYTQSCLTLCNPMDCSPPGSSVRGSFQATILEWVAISHSRARPRIQVLLFNHHS